MLLTALVFDVLGSAFADQIAAIMNVGVASSNPNPNTDYFNSRGMWVTYILVVIVGHYVLLSIPTISVAAAWTATHFTHNVVSFLL